MTRGPALYSRSVTIWFHSECLSKCSLIHSTLAPPQPLKTKRALFGVSRKFPQICIHQFATQVAVPAYYFNQLRKDGLERREKPREKLGKAADSVNRWWPAFCHHPTALRLVMVFCSNWREKKICFPCFAFPSGSRECLR